MNYRITEADYAAIQASRAQHVPANRIDRVRKQQTDAVVSAEICDARHEVILALRGVNMDGAKREKLPKLTFTLPYPPSANTYWRHPTTGKLAGRHMISADGRAYRENVGIIIERNSLQAGLADAVRVEVKCFAPDKRKRDLGNLEKALFDALTHAGVWDDDSQAEDIRFYWARASDAKVIVPGGRVELTIEALA